MVEAGVMADETYLWYDVRPHPQLRHGRGPRDGRADPRRAHARPDRADPGDGQGARRALRGGQAARRLPVRDARREQVARRPPRARGRARRPARAPDGPTKELARRLYDRLREHAQDLGGGERARGDPRPAREGHRAPRASGSSTRRTTTGRSCSGDRRRHDADENGFACQAPARRSGTQRRRTRVEPSATYPCEWQAARTCSSSAAAAGGRCRRTSPNARTAATGCASARRSSSAAGRRSRPSRRASGRRWGA